jgi:hypothetical protein
MKRTWLALSVMAAVSHQAAAFQFDTPDDWEVRWDNTIKANVASRVAKQDKDVYEGGRGNSAAGANLADDSTLSVDRSSLGLISTRIDVLSEFDVIYQGNFGFRISASGWYDHAYKDSDHPRNRRFSWATPSVDPGEFGEDAEDLHYFGGEILDAFVFGNWEIGDTALGLRAGRHTIYWGNSLLSTGAIAGVGGAMAPLDFSKALAVPGSEAKELFMPSAKISGVWQLTDNVTLNAYYGLEHLRYRLPETGTYFSPAEGLTEDTEFVTLIAGEPRVGVRMHKDKTESQEWGFNLQYYFEPWGLETSFIYLNYVDKNLHGLHAGLDLGPFGRVLASGDSAFAPLAAQLMGLWDLQCSLGTWECPNDPYPFDNDPSTGAIIAGDARWLFKEDIDLFAISLSKEIAGISFGADIVLRQDTGLAPDLETNLGAFHNSPDPSITGLVIQALGANEVPGDYFSYDSDNYRGPVGDVWSVVVNGIGFLKNNGIWEGGSYIVEATFQMLDDCTADCEWLDYRVKENRVVSTVGAIFKPTWYQVYPGWDLSVPVTVSYTIDGEKSPFTFGGDEERGNASIGAEFLINESWNFAARYNIFFGPVAAGIGGLLKDRDNISLTLKRTF